MNILGLLTGNTDYIGLVKEFIDKVLIHEAKKYHCNREDIKIIIHPEPDNNISIASWSNITKQTLRIIPNKEIQDILTK
jgi:hypothetical protein